MSLSVHIFGMHPRKHKSTTKLSLYLVFKGIYIMNNLLRVFRFNFDFEACIQLDREDNIYSVICNVSFSMLISAVFKIQ